MALLNPGIFGATDTQKLSAVQNRLGGQPSILGGAAAAQAPPSCTEDPDCPTGQECVDGKCKAITPECSQNSDCQAGEECVAGKCKAKGVEPECNNTGTKPCPTGRCVAGKCVGISCNATNCPPPKTCVNDICVGVECDNGTPCPAGNICSNGHCVQIVPECSASKPCPSGKKCVNGKCVVNCTQDSNCPTGQKCVNGNCQTVTNPACTKDADCPADQKCVNGVCQPITTPSCGKGANGAATTACPCGDGFYRTNEADACPSGYRSMGVGENARCECDSYVPPATCTNNGDCPAGQSCINGRCETPGEFKWSAGTSALMKRLQERANWLLDNPGGMTAEERAAIQNRSFEAIKAQERPQLQATQDRLARMGLLGTGFQNAAEATVRRGTAANLASTQRDLAIQEQTTKVDNLIKTTGLAQEITNQGISSEQIVEALNAARRGEGRSDQSLLLQYLSLLFGNQNTAYGAYWQSLLAQMG